MLVAESLMPQSIAHLLSLSRSVCLYARWSSHQKKERKKKEVLRGDCCLTVSLALKRLNNVGEITEPCGMPLIILVLF